MAIVFSLSPKLDASGQQEILVRYKSGNFAARAKSGLFVLSDWYDYVIGNNVDTPHKGKRLITDEMRKMETFHKQQKTKFSEMVEKITETLKTADKSNSDWLKLVIDKYNFPEKYAPKVDIVVKQSFFDAFEEFLDKHPLSEVRKKNYRVVVRALKRYEYVKQTKNVKFTLELDTITPEIVQDFSNFLRTENETYLQHPDIYELYPEYRTPEPRGQNTISGMLTKMRTFFLWTKKNKRTTNDPFENFKIDECVYGTPYYITIEERNQIYNADFSKFPHLERQKDIFVFQCVIGCRVADLYRFTKNNIINGAIEYIARKTTDGNPITVRVPLNTIAKEILKKYNNLENNAILPFISVQKYNDSIKEVFTIAEITRKVTTLDPLTREQVIQPINEIASSHLARRAFVGNLYKQVKDPNLVGALSGHKEGSKAFARYRDVDEEMKQELVKMLE